MNRVQASRMLSKGFEITHPSLTLCKVVTMQDKFFIMDGEEAISPKEFWRQHIDDAYDNDWKLTDNPVNTDVKYRSLVDKLKDLNKTIKNLQELWVFHDVPVRDMVFKLEIIRSSVEQDLQAITEVKK